ncbi:MAG TPA: penicillin-binding transpeptidase domain-containing protein [Bacteriovoracaceae bacterium]|nr:penicillin-binding transpeptidase domain-containing protein [Bacteriovoracaceae bacterium]
MKIIALMLLILMCTAISCGFLHPKREQKAHKLPATLEKTSACFILYDLKKEKVVEVINEDRCNKRFPACSTFKIPLAVMAFDQGILRGPNSSPYEWDGKKRMILTWNKNHTGKTWMQDSVVWFSQRMTKDMGRKKIQGYLDKFNYGNRDFSGGIEDAWLTPAPFLEKPPKTTVMISAMEQIEFMKALYLYRLPVSLNAMTMTQNLLPSETSQRGSVLTGKTGSGFVGEGSRRRLGWFVANVKSGTDEYLSVLSFDDNEPGFGGNLAKESMKQILLEKGLW